MLTAITQQLMAAEAQEACGAEYGERSAERVNSRNGFRLRDWDTRVFFVDRDRRREGIAEAALAGALSST